MKLVDFQENDQKLVELQPDLYGMQLFNHLRLLRIFEIQFEHWSESA